MRFGKSDILHFSPIKRSPVFMGVAWSRHGLVWFSSDTAKREYLPAAENVIGLMLTTDKSSPSDMKMAGVGDKMLPTI
jgi:hypothetical protein